MIKIGSLFSGIGGFELGCQWAFEKANIDHQIMWQCEKDNFCRKVLKKHWPNTKIYNDITKINPLELEPVDIIMGGFPCQDISIANTTGEGLNGKKSGLFWKMFGIIGDLRPRITVLENVANFTVRGLSTVCGAFAEIGYNAEWEIISASMFGAPHLRKRLFFVAYPNQIQIRKQQKHHPGFQTSVFSGYDVNQTTSHADGNRYQKPNGFPQPVTNLGEKIQPRGQTPQISNATKAHNQGNGVQIGNEFANDSHFGPRNAGQKCPWKMEAPASIYRMDDGVSRKLYRNNNKRIAALGNAIVPQCSEYIFDYIIKRGLLDGK